MRAKDLADLAGTTVRTIRYYHQLGLLSVPETGTSWRSYGFAHLTRLMRIRWLVESGVPLAEVPHMLRPPASSDERHVVDEDLTAVLASMDTRIASLTAQRTQVVTLLERVRAHGRLSPLPPSLVHLYAVLLDRPMPPSLRVAISRERDLLELACYRGGMPPSVESLVDALCERHLDELLELWAAVHAVHEETRGPLTSGQRQQLDDVVERVIELARECEPGAAARLLARAAELDRPGIRAAVDLAYPSAAYRHVVRAVIAHDRERDIGSIV